MDIGGGVWITGRNFTENFQGGTSSGSIGRKMLELCDLQSKRFDDLETPERNDVWPSGLWENLKFGRVAFETDSNIFEKKDKF